MVLTIIISLASLIGLLVIHEYGHFILARKFGVKVEEFGIGFPPRLIAKKIGETVYSLNLLPIGAFVKIYGEEKQIEDSQSFFSKPIWQRALIIFGGALSFWIVAIILLTIVVLLANPNISWYQAPVQGVIVTGRITVLVIKAWGLALTNVFTGQPSGVQLTGPVGILGMLNQASQLGLAYFINFIAMISIHLALINLAPIPAVDGGKLLFLAIEKLRGKPISEKVDQTITGIVFALLIALMLFVTFKDITRLFG